MAELVERFEEGPMREALGDGARAAPPHAAGLMFEAARTARRGAVSGLFRRADFRVV